MQRNLTRWVLPLLLFLPSPSMAAILRVKADAPGPTHDGAAWDTAFTTITGALAAASPGDDIWVAAGDYAGVTPVTMRDGVSLYGGFSGSETKWEERDPGSHASVLKPAAGIHGVSVVVAPAGVTAATVLDGFTITGGSGRASSTGVSGGGVLCDQSSPVISHNVFIGNLPGVACVGGAAQITGNTFTHNTEPNRTLFPSIGGAVFLHASGASVSGNWFSENIGAVACVYGGTPVVRDNVMSGNMGVGIFCNADAEVSGNSIDGTSQYGIVTQKASPFLFSNRITDNPNGVFVTWGAPVIMANTISGASATLGSAIYAERASLVIVGNHITGNPSGGAPVYVPPATDSSLSIQFDDNDVSGNVGRSDVGALYISGSGIDAEIIGNVFARNTSPSSTIRIETHTLAFKGNHVDANHVAEAGAVVDLLPSQEVRDNVFALNITDTDTTAILHVNGGNLMNNTFVENGLTGAAGSTFRGAHMVVNNIVAFNGGPIQGASYSVFRNNLVYGNLKGNYQGVADPTGADGNLSVDPVFVDRAASDYRLVQGSPAINAGDDSVLLPGELDADMSARLLGAHVDIGAFESAEHNPALLADALTALRLSGGLDAALPADLPDLDTDASGAVDVRDATRLMRRAIGLKTP